MSGVRKETQRRPPLVPKGRVPRAARSTGSRVPGRASPCSLVLIAGHLESVAACALRMCGTSVCVVCGASVCVVLRHHWALNEHVHACAWFITWMVPSIACMRVHGTCECLHGAMCTVRTAAQTYVYVCNCMCMIVCLYVYNCMLEGV